MLYATYGDEGSRVQTFMLRFTTEIMVALLLCTLFLSWGHAIIEMDAQKMIVTAAQQRVTLPPALRSVIVDGSEDNPL